MWRYERMDADEARMLNPLQLAYIGDNVWEMLVRSMLVRKRYNVNHMHKAAIALVNAHAQNEALKQIEGILTEDEHNIVLRGRNCHAKHASPKNQDPADYAGATGFESLIGYLYLIGNEDRIFEFFNMVVEDKTNG